MTAERRNEIVSNDILKYIAGFSAGIVCGAVLMKKYQQIKAVSKINARPSIDHVVIRSRDKTNECKMFYRCLGFEIEREKESIQWEKTGKGSVKFPMVRINDEQAIDLFGSSTKQFWCKKNEGNVDHLCIAMSADDHINALQKLKENSVSVIKQFKAWGACGYGWSTYTHDPTGLYVEIRNYEKKRWKEVEDLAASMML